MNGICGFCGHRNCDTILLREKIKNEITDLIEFSSINTFFSGGIGMFDTLCENVVRELKKKYNIKLYLIAPYFTQRINKDKQYYMEKYDEIIIPDLGNIHFKRAIGARNKWIAEQSDVILCYVVHSSGGAYQMLKYARKINKSIRKI